LAIAGMAAMLAGSGCGSGDQEQEDPGPSGGPWGAPQTFHSFGEPTAIVADPAGGTLYVAVGEDTEVEVVDIATGVVTRLVDLDERPNGLAISSSGDRLVVAAGGPEGEVKVVEVPLGDVEGTIDVGHTPMSPVVSGAGDVAYVANRFSNTVSVIDLDEREETATIAVSREPVALALTPDSATLLVANHLPAGAANTGTTAAVVSVIDTQAATVSSEIQLLDGATGLRGMAVSPDGKHAYVTHLLARYKMPTNQLDRGWIMTNALAIIDVAASSLVTTVLLDDVLSGAANPWDVEIDGEGRSLCVTAAGTHELIVIDREGLHARLEAIPYPGGFSQTLEDVPHDLGFLSDLKDRITLLGNGPRDLVLVGSDAFAVERFSDSVARVLEYASDAPTALDMGPDPDSIDETLEQVGERIYNDATLTYQQWLSCASCHPDGRADALNWDLGNDGLGSPRNAKSLLRAHATPPAMISGIRADAETAVRAGFKFIQFSIRPEEDAEAVDAFLRSMEPVPSPYLVDGGLGDAAERGQALFDGAGCGDCHSGEHLTDMQLYDVGTGRAAKDNPDALELLDTPTLVEMWRTGPYLQDGGAATMEEVLTTFNEGDAHGVTSSMSDSDIADLTAYVLSL
jgi:YVTN family beta-propeller protein